MKELRREYLFTGVLFLCVAVIDAGICVVGLFMGVNVWSAIVFAVIFGVAGVAFIVKTRSVKQS